jgi:hypothetical protein
MTEELTSAEIHQRDRADFEATITGGLLNKQAEGERFLRSLGFNIPDPDEIDYSAYEKKEQN